MNADVFGVYVHVPFCATRCGYCDFNTYTPQESGGANPDGYVEAALTEMRLAAQRTQHLGAARTVFFGGGTPTLLELSQLKRLLNGVRETFGIADNAEITTEANPETLTPARLEQLRAAGLTRLSIGMQSASERVLATLDRQHTPGRAVAVAQAAHTAGFEHVSLDLIYGTPGESDTEWRESLHAAIEAGVDHVSAYSLTVEPGTRMFQQVRSGLLRAPDADLQADRYIAADEMLTEAGFTWYEISNWARTHSAQCQHNLGYWRGGQWWGIGPGAHSFLKGERFWNVKHPRRYAADLARDQLPIADSERLTEAEKRLEEIMLGVRVREGLVLSQLCDAAAAQQLADEKLIVPEALASGTIQLTRQGRLLADTVVHRLLGS